MYYFANQSSRVIGMTGTLPGKIMIMTELFRALRNPVSLGIVEFLHDGEKSVREVAQKLDSKVSSVYRHLSALRKNGIITSRREGTIILYRVVMPGVLDFLQCLEKEVAERLERQRRHFIA